VRFTPFSGYSWNENVHADDDPAETGGPLAWFNLVGPGYVRTLQTPLVAGRDFGPHDDASAPKVAIVNRKLARDLFGDASPIGRRFRYEAYDGRDDPSYEIVGMVGDTKYAELREDPRGIAYFPVAQDDHADERAFVLRARGRFASVMEQVMAEMAALNGSLLVEFRIMQTDIDRSVSRERLMATLTGGFGLLAALLSALGLYGVMAYMVARRRGEIGVRMALGARRGDIGAMVLGEAGRLVLLGLVLGLGASLVLARSARSFLYGLEATDPATLALGCALLTATAFVATSLPVRRATRLDPVAVLRDE
jgi:predicted permease